MSLSTSQITSSNTAIIALGANLGDAQATLQEVAKLINNIDGIQIQSASSLYSTKPVGYVDQDDFINAVMQIKTTLSPRELYAELEKLEQQYGRKRVIKNGPRTLDLDVISYGDLISDDEKVILPHPRAQERAFVLVPLCEINSEHIFSDSKQSAKQALSKIAAEDLAGVIKLSTKLIS